MNDSKRQSPDPQLHGPPVERSDGDWVPNGAERDLFGPARMNAVHAERAAAAESIRRRLAVQRKASGAASPVKIPQGGGQGLPADVRERMEPRLGADLSGVKLHVGGESAQAAAGLGARAFTVGSDVHFNAGEFAPGTKEGDRLLAHELTHVVQGQQAGVQRKADESERGAGHGGADAGHDHAGAAEHGGHEVSQPGEPAEKEADSVADKVADDLHGAGKQPKGEKQKKEKDGKKSAHGQGQGKEHEHDASAGHGADQEHAEKGGAKEKAAPIAAKLSSVGRKIIFRSPRAGSNPPTITATTGAKIHRAATPPAPAPAPRAGGGGAAPPTADPEMQLPDIQKQLVDLLAPKNVYSTTETAPLAKKLAPSGKIKKSEFDAKKGGNLEPELLLEWRLASGDESFANDYCKPDAIAVRNLNQVAGANAAHFEGGGSTYAKCKKDFFDALGTKLISGGVKRTSVYNATFNDAAAGCKFKGKKITDKLPQLMQRAMSYTDFRDYNINPAELSRQACEWYNGRAGQHVTQNVFDALPDAQKLKEDYLKQAGGNEGQIRAMVKGTLTWRQNWWTPNALQIKAGEAGFAQIMTIFALEPQYFSQGTVLLTADLQAVSEPSLVEARKPTCFDGMQSSMWVPREDGGDAFGVTGGGVQEALMKGIDTGAIKRFQCNFPAPDVAQAIQTFNTQVQAKTGGSAMDALQRTQGDAGARGQLTQNMKNAGPGGNALNDMSQGINNRTAQERASPTPTAQAEKNSTVQSAGTQRPRTV